MKGHADDPDNERVDRLAVAAMKALAPDARQAGPAAPSPRPFVPRLF